MVENESVNSQLMMRIVVDQDGERFPMLLDANSCLPVYLPAAYLMVIIRPKGHQFESMRSQLCAIKFLYDWASTRAVSIDVDSRFYGGGILNISEVEDLSSSCRFHHRELYNVTVIGGGGGGRKLRSLESFRMRKNNRVEVSMGTAAKRMRYIRDYLLWLCDRSTDFVSIHSVDVSFARKNANDLYDMIGARIPKCTKRNSESLPGGLSKYEEMTLVDVTCKYSADNIWVLPFIKVRNELIVQFMLEVGCRRGELLSISTTQVDVQGLMVAIVRMPDNVLDSRVDQPNVKTNERVVPISPHLSELIKEYINHWRSHLVGARRHGFLIVAENGAPLSKSGFNKIFCELRRAFPRYLGRLTPHVLRHTWNDRFSEQMELKGISNAVEEKWRSYLQGWCEGSGSASNYTRRYVRQQAQQALKAMQKNMFAGR